MKKQVIVLSVFAAVIIAALLSGQAGADPAVMLHFRLPRILAACIAGAALGISGTLFQGVLKNPLADPYLLGTSAGASAMAALCLVNGAGRTNPVFFIAVFAGAFGGTFISYFIAKAAGKLSDASLVLSGVAVSAFLTAMLMFFINFGGEKAFSLMSFIMGGFSVPSMPEIAVSATVFATVFIISIINSRYLDAFSLGEEKAYHLGADPAKGRILFFMLASAAAAAAVSLCGTVGFIGLMVPHIMRLMFSPLGRSLLPAAATGGAILLCAADTVGRTAFSPHEIPAGIIMALAGAPFFLWLLFRSRRDKTPVIISEENLQNKKLCPEIPNISENENGCDNFQKNIIERNFQNDEQNYENEENNDFSEKKEIIDKLLTNCSYLEDYNNSENDDKKNQSCLKSLNNVENPQTNKDIQKHSISNDNDIFFDVSKKDEENNDYSTQTENNNSKTIQRIKTLLSVKNISFYWQLKIDRNVKYFIKNNNSKSEYSKSEKKQKDAIENEIFTNSSNSLDDENYATENNNCQNLGEFIKNKNYTQNTRDVNNNIYFSNNGNYTTENTKAQNIGRIYKNTNTECLFENLSFDLLSGDFLGILGPNGAGKSTLLKIITGFIKNNAEIYAGGKRRSEYPAAAIASIMAWLPGEIDIPYDFTVRDFAEMGRCARHGFNSPLTSADIDAVNDAMRLAGVLRLADRNINSLSSGERQLASLAQALAQDADILLLDEPVSHLDLYYKERFMEIVAGLTQEKRKAAIAVLHEPALACHCNKILLLGRGWHFLGTPQEALQPRMLARLYGISENSPLLACQQ